MIYRCLKMIWSISISQRSWVHWNDNPVCCSICRYSFLRFLSFTPSWFFPFYCVACISVRVDAAFAHTLLLKVSQVPPPFPTIMVFPLIVIHVFLSVFAAAFAGALCFFKFLSSQPSWFCLFLSSDACIFSVNHNPPAPVFCYHTQAHLLDNGFWN